MAYHHLYTNRKYIQHVHTARTVQLSTYSTTHIYNTTHTHHITTHTTHTHYITTHHITHITSHHVRTNLIPLIPYECTSCSTAADIVAIAAGSVIPADTYIVNVCMYVRTVRNNLLIIISVQ